MKQLIYGIGAVFLILSCRPKNDYSTQTQDSLLVVLNTQRFLLNQLPVLEKKDFSPKDSLSHTDSVLYKNIFINYQKSLSVADSIRILVKHTLAECDTLNKHRNITDTAIIHRLQYITQLYQNYLQEYYRSTSIAEQNRTLLQLLSK